MTLLELLTEAHIRKHRVSHACDRLTEPEETLFKRVKRTKDWKIAEDSLTAHLEPRRYGVNWRQELLEVKGEAYVQALTAEAKAKTEKAQRKFEREAPDWRADTLGDVRLVITG